MKKIAAAVSSYFRTTDKWLLLFWLTASGLSILFLAGLYNSGLLSGTGAIKTQAILSGLGLVAALVISTIDYHLLLKLWKLYLPAALILVGLTFISGLGSVRGDNQAWLALRLGGTTFTIQPSEFLKIVFITTFAMHLEKARDELNRLPNIGLLCLHGGAYALLIQLQGDTGSALIFLAIFLVMLFCAGIQWRYILAAMLAMVAAAPLLWFKFLSQDQKMRVLTVLNPSLDKDYAWQQMRGINALGYGGMQGTGIFAGKHIKVPEIYNDFIFSFIGESTGFIGSLGIIILLLVIAFKIFYNAGTAMDGEGKFICIGVFAMIISQTIINLGMCLSLLPVIGVTLPLLSAGGSSVLSMYCGLGLVLSIYRHSKTTLFYE